MYWRTTIPIKCEACEGKGWTRKVPPGGCGNRDCEEGDCRWCHGRGYWIDDGDVDCGCRLCGGSGVGRDVLEEGTGRCHNCTVKCSKCNGEGEVKMKVAQVKEYVQRAKDAEAEISRLGTQVKDLQAQLDTFRGSRAAYQEEISQLGAQVKELQGSLEITGAEKAQLEKRLGDMAQELETASRAKEKRDGGLLQRLSCARRRASRSLAAVELDEDGHDPTQQPKVMAVVSLPGGAEYESNRCLLKKLGFETPVVFFPDAEKPTDPQHPFEVVHPAGSPKDLCWQCQWVQNLNLLHKKNPNLWFTAINGGGPGCAWERACLKALYPTMHNVQG